MNDKQNRIAEILNFFNELFGKISESHFGYLIRFKDYTKIYAFNVTDENQRKAMARKAIELNDKGFEIWHAVNIVSIEPKDGKRGDETVVSYQTACVVDIDIQSDAHKSNNLAKSFDEAKSFLPFTPSLIINSGYGLHAYFIFDTPIKITDDNREELKRRNNLLLDVIRQRVNGKKIDGVGDLPRILRTSGTFNYKLGKDNAPLCHIVEDSGLRFSPNELDERMNDLIQPQSPKSQSTGSPSKKFKKDFADDNDFNLFCVRRMLDFISPSSLTYDDWLAVGMALKNSGFDCSDWEIWSRADERFKYGECESKWNGFNRDGYSIATICMFAQQNGYDAKETYREWYELYPNLRPSAKRNMDEEIKRELDDAIIWLDTLEPENFTATDAHSSENIHAVALATVFGFSAKAEKFFKTIKDAKAIAKNRIKESDANLTKKLSEYEMNELTALVEGINLDSVRRTVDREITAVTRARDQFLREKKASSPH